MNNLVVTKGRIQTCTSQIQFDILCGQFQHITVVFLHVSQTPLTHARLRSKGGITASLTRDVSFSEWNEPLLGYCALMFKARSRHFWWYSLRWGKKRGKCVSLSRTHTRKRRSGALRPLKFITLNNAVEAQKPQARSW